MPVFKRRYFLGYKTKVKQKIIEKQQNSNDINKKNGYSSIGGDALVEMMRNNQIPPA